MDQETRVETVAMLARLYGGFTTEVWSRLQALEMNMEMRAQQEVYEEYLRELAKQHAAP